MNAIFRKCYSNLDNNCVEKSQEVITEGPEINVHDDVCSDGCIAGFLKGCYNHATRPKQYISVSKNKDMF